MEDQLGHIEHQKVTNLLPFIGAAAVFLIIIGLIFMNRPTYKYKMSTEEMKDIVLKRDYLFKTAQIFDAIYNKDSIYQFIDLRSAPEYLESHIDGAINISLHEILNPENKKILNQNKKINIIYFNDQSGACSAWMILRQLGYKNIYVLQGGYDFVKPNMIDKYNPMAAGSTDEKPQYNYNEVVNSSAGNSQSTQSENNDESSKVTLKPKKKTSGGGGC